MENIINSNVINVTEEAFFDLFGKTNEGKALAEKQAKEEAERHQRWEARMKHIEHKVSFVENLFEVSLSGLAQLIAEFSWNSGEPRRIGKLFLTENTEFSRQKEVNREPMTLSNDKYIVKLGEFDKTVGAPKVIVADATEGGIIDQPISKKKADKVAAAKAKAAAAEAKAAADRAVELADYKKRKGNARVQKLTDYLSLISQKTPISSETVDFLMTDLPNCSLQFKASKEEVLSYKDNLDAKTFPEQIPDNGAFAVLTPIRQEGELKDFLFVYVPEIDARKALAFQLRKFISEEEVSRLMENLPGDAKSWYTNIWRRQGKENYIAYSEGIAKALHLEAGQVAYDLLQGVVKIVQPAGKGGTVFVMTNPNETSCFIVEKPNGKMIPNLYLPK